MITETIEKFGYPNSLIKEYDNWYLLLRPAQVTIGSMVLISKTDDTNFSDLSAEAFVELKVITEDIERRIKSLLGFDKVNYKMLMMVDPEVHFHVFPRYSKRINLLNREFDDQFWPGICDLTKTLEVSESEFEELLTQLKKQLN